MQAIENPRLIQVNLHICWVLEYRGTINHYSNHSKFRSRCNKTPNEAVLDETGNVQTPMVQGNNVHQHYDFRR